MASLLHNLTESLQEMNERLKLIEEQGPNAIKTIYPYATLDGCPAYYDLLQSLPKEIKRLESKINELKPE